MKAMTTERQEDGRPIEWDWVLVCAKGHAAGTWAECRGGLARVSEDVGAMLLCESHGAGGEYEWNPDGVDPSEAWERPELSEEEHAALAKFKAVFSRPL